jgi:hypothetical protein
VNVLQQNALLPGEAPNLGQIDGIRSDTPRPEGGDDNAPRS